MAASEPESPSSVSFLRAHKGFMVDEQDSKVILQGCNLGNWLLLEMWMIENYKDFHDHYSFEKNLGDRFGPEEQERLMELYRSNYIQPRDFDIISSFGFNVVRLPFRYDLLEDDDRPFELRPNAFKWLDRAIEMAEAVGIYVILDMHGVAGGQCVDHTTGRLGQNELWTSEHHQKRAAWLWKQIADRYKDRPSVAAYDVINEPFGDWKTDIHLQRLPDVFDRIYRAIREVDTKHVILIPGPIQGIELYGSPADRGWENVGFTEHYYPTIFHGERTLEAHADFINHHLPYRAEYLKKYETPFLVGEFNVVFAHLGGTPLMRRYFDEYARYGWAATMWSYKLVTRNGGIGHDNWYMVANVDPMPEVDFKTSSLEDIEAWCRWMGEMEYGIYEDLREALTTDNPAQLVLKSKRIPFSTPPTVDNLPGWEATDIGGSLAGGQRVHGEDAFDIFGGGRDIWNSEDQFRFVWRKVQGDFSIRVRVDSLLDTNPYAKAGLMARNNLEPGSEHVLAHIYPDGRIALGQRPQANAGMQEEGLRMQGAPVYMAMERNGQTLNIGYSMDGKNWPVKFQRTADWLGPDCYVGMAVLAHAENRELTTARFGEVKIKGTSP